MKYNIRKEEKAITLIALIVTVILMLILAGVTLNFTIGERGIFNTAKSTKDTREDSRIYRAS